ncbi:hypothetical protein GGR51DRAFT_386189 [Nemania sp. FL0031]|nr:hypothetical protein GGR51DRAFT_386189 [Nemania sp. FL0031]
MSHLTEFSILLSYVKRRLRGEESTDEQYQYGRFAGVTVQLPLPGVPSSRQVAEFYSRLSVEVEISRLEPERKMAYQRFASAAYLAHRATEENQPPFGFVWHLEDCVTYITKALRQMEQSKEYDDSHPVHWSEVYRGERPPEWTQHTTPPQEYWLLFKLESLLPVLRLSVRILRLAFPDCSQIWNEWENGLCGKEWLQRFVLDTRMSCCSMTPLHAPCQADGADPDSSECFYT